MGWKVQICDGDDNIYITRAEQVQHQWARIDPPTGGGLEDIYFYNQAIYCVDKENGFYWRGRLPGGYRGGNFEPDWENLGGDGGSRICVGEGFLFAYCYSDPGNVYRSDSPATGGGNDHWTRMGLPEEGLRGWSMYDGELYFTCGDNGNYYKTNCRNLNPRQMYGDGGWEIATGGGYMIAAATSPSAGEADCSLFIGRIGRRRGVDHEGLAWEQWGRVPGGINSICIYNGNCHIIAKTHKGDRMNLALPVEGWEDFRDDPDAWCEVYGDGGWKHHVAGKKTHGGGYKGGHGHHGSQRRNWEDEVDWDDFSSSDDYSDSDDDWESEW